MGARIRELRRSQRMTLRELARRIGVSAATVSQLENGRTEIFLGRLMQIAAALDTSAGLLLEASPLGPGELSRPSGIHNAPGCLPEDRGRKLRDAVGRARRCEGSDWRAFPPLDLGPVLTAALDAFLESGYGGSSVREIARRCSLSIPGLYHHYASKQDMLMDLLEIYMDSLLWRTAAARAAGDDPVQRFALLVECLALHHTYRRALAFVGLSEMRSLAPANRHRILDLRNQQQRMVDSEAEDAHALGQFRISDPHDASRAVVTMCTSIPHWYRPDGPATPEQIACQYVHFALNLMNCAIDPSASRCDGRQTAADGCSRNRNSSRAT